MPKLIFLFLIGLLSVANILAPEEISSPSIQNPDSWTVDFIRENPAVYQTNPQAVIEQFPQEAKQYFSDPANVAANTEGYSLVIARFPEEIVTHPAAYEKAISTDITILNNNKAALWWYAQSKGVVFQPGEFQIVGDFSSFSEGTFVTKGVASTSFTIQHLQKLKDSEYSNFKVEPDGLLSFSKQDKTYALHGTVEMDEEQKVILTKGSLQHPDFMETITIPAECSGCSLRLNPDGTVLIKGANFLLPGGEILAEGEALLHSTTWVTFRGWSTFFTPEKGRFSITRETDYFTNELDHSNNEQSYIQSYFTLEATDAGLRLDQKLSITLREENTITATLSSGHEYTDLAIDSRTGMLTLVEKTNQGEITLIADHGEMFTQGNVQQSEFSEITSLDNEGNVLSMVKSFGEQQLSFCPVEASTIATGSVVTGFTVAGKKCRVTVTFSPQLQRNLKRFGEDYRKMRRNAERAFLTMVEEKYQGRVKDFKIKFVEAEEMPGTTASWVEWKTGTMYIDVNKVKPQVFYGADEEGLLGLFISEQDQETFTHEYAHAFQYEQYPSSKKEKDEHFIRIASEIDRLKKEKGLKTQGEMIKNPEIARVMVFESKNVGISGQFSTIITESNRMINTEIQSEPDNTVGIGRAAWKDTGRDQQTRFGCFTAYMCSNGDEYISVLATFVRHKPELVAETIKSNSHFYQQSSAYRQHQGQQYTDPRFKQGLELAQKYGFISAEEYNRVIELSRQPVIYCQYCQEYY